MKSFEDIYKSVIEKASVIEVGCFLLYQFLKHASKLEGEVAEVGVYRGGTAKVLAEACPDKPIHLFDTFKGMPDILEVDKHLIGAFDETSIEEVREYLKEYPNVYLYPGIFPSTIEAVKDKKFCFVHCDADIYKSTFDCLDFFYTRMVKGGVMLFHDYNFRQCPGVKKAISEFLVGRPEYPIYLVVQYYCLIIKI